MIFGFIRNQKHKKTISWAHEIFIHLPPETIPADAKTFYTHRLADTSGFDRQDGSKRLFTSLGHDHHSPQSDATVSIQKHPDEQHLNHHHPSDQLLHSHLIRNNRHLQKWPSPFAELTVTEVINEAENVKTICLAGWQAFSFHYAPGQFITLLATINGQSVQRSYSIASSPSRPHGLEITVKRIPGGLVSNWLCDHIKVGDTLKVKAPSGRFSCFNFPARKLLFLAAGSGIVPIMSMLRWIVDTHAKVDVQLILSCKIPADIIYREELKFIATRHANIDVLITFTGTPRNDHDWSGHTGRIDAKILSETVKDLTERQVFLCGPEQFMQSAAEILIRQGAEAMNIHHESFITKMPPVTDHKAVAAIKNNQGKYRVQFVKSGLSVRSDEKTSLLDLAAAHDIRIDSDCRTGSCGECMIRCLWGKVDMSEEAEIDPRDKQAGWIYSCCAYPRSDLVLDV